MKFTTIVAVLTFCSAIVSAEAATQRSTMTLSGSQLLDACTRADPEWIGFCNGYIQAAFDATGGKEICAPKGITRNQLFDAIIPKLKGAPELLKIDAVSVVGTLLRKSYPCK